MIICSNISKKIGSFFLGQLSFEIPDGYICGLVGQNGSGMESLYNGIL